MQTLTFIDIISILAALTAILMAGSTHLRTNIALFSAQTFFLAAATALFGYMRHDSSLYVVAFAIFLLKACGIPMFLKWIISKVKVTNDTGITIPAPLAMHISVILMGLGYFLTLELPPSPIDADSWACPTASISLLFTGLVLMLTRRIALSQIIGFLVLENGIYLFYQSQTVGMHLVMEMGVLLDIFTAVMIAGLVVFRIQSSFEHVDVTQLSELKE